MSNRNRRFAVVAIAVAVTIVGAVLVATFVGSEKKIDQPVERRYPLDEPRFKHELGVPLGPPFLDGTRTRALLNGDQIFPPMPVAIRSATRSIFSAQL